MDLENPRCTSRKQELSTLPWYNPQRWRLSLIVLVLLQVSVVMLGSVYVYANYYRTDNFNPIRFTTQRIERLERIPGADESRLLVPEVIGYQVPSVMAGDDVPVRGLVCNDSNQPVPVVGSLLWRRVDAPGASYMKMENIPGIISPGCEQTQFENPMPDYVTDIADKVGVSEWIITGTVTPTQPGGVSQVWASEHFTIVGS